MEQDDSATQGTKPMNPTTLFVVMGTTGEYSDRSEWAVCAYADIESAQAHAEAATKEAKRIEATTPRYEHEPDDDAKLWDAEMSIFYTGTDYTVVEVPLRTVLPAPRKEQP